VCEGEFEIGLDALQSLVDSLGGYEIDVFILDDGSPSLVGQNIAKKLHIDKIQAIHHMDLPVSLGFRGSAQRAFIGLSWIHKSAKEFDVIIKIDADAVVLREDLGQHIQKALQDGKGLYGVEYLMRKRDRILYMADQLRLGFARKLVNGIIQRRWKIGRNYPVWWADIGEKARRNGFNYRYIPGCFWFLGPETLNALADAGYLDRDQSNFGFVFNDDLILTSATAAIEHPIVDLTKLSSAWLRSMGLSELEPIELIQAQQPYVVHPLKNYPAANARREELKKLFPHYS